MEQIIGILGMLFFGYCLRWKWDVPRGTSTPADFEEKKRLYKEEEAELVQCVQTEEKIEKRQLSEPSEAKIRISANMVETVKIGGKWYDVVDANFFEVIK